MLLLKQIKECLTRICLFLPAVFGYGPRYCVGGRLASRRPQCFRLALFLRQGILSFY